MNTETGNSPSVISVRAGEALRTGELVTLRPDLMLYRLDAAKRGAVLVWIATAEVAKGQMVAFPVDFNSMTVNLISLYYKYAKEQGL